MMLATNGTSRQHGIPRSVAMPSMVPFAIRQVVKEAAQIHGRSKHRMLTSLLADNN